MPGWSYAHCLPYFRKSETWEKGADPYRGDRGPLHVTDGPGKNPLYGAFIEAGVQAGYPPTSDMNGYQQEGFGPMQMTTHKGRRWSTANAYLRPVLHRPNLKVMVKTLTNRILFDGTRATGVDVRHKGKQQNLYANREVLCCGGAINSPQLLMLSGIGAADQLKPLGIPVVHNLPGVGENLQDHLEIYVQMACTQPITLYAATKPLNKLKIGLQWLLFRSGLGATSTIFYLWLSPMTAHRQPTGTDFRRTSAPCAPPVAAMFACHPLTPPIIRRFCSTTCQPSRTARKCGPPFA